MSELDPVLLRAFSAARAERPRSGKGKAQTLAALGLASATAHASSLEPSSSARAGSLRLPGWRWWTIGIALVATSGALLRVDEEIAQPPVVGAALPRPSETPAVRVAGSEIHAPPPTLSVVQLPNAPASTNAPEPANVVEAANRRPASDTKSARCTTCLPAQPAGSERIKMPEPAARGSASLREEIEAVERASRALSERRCALASAHLAAYQAKFPNGRLQREAEVVAIEIAGRSGRHEHARVAARRFVEKFPDTPYALRLAPWLRDGATEEPGMCTDAAE